MSNKIFILDELRDFGSDDLFVECPNCSAQFISKETKGIVVAYCTVCNNFFNKRGIFSKKEVYEAFPEDSFWDDYDE